VAVRRIIFAVIALIAVSSLLAACGGKSAFELQVGDCFDDPESFEEVDEVPERDCEEPHDNEVYANRDIPGTEWPGQATVEEWADEACLEEFEPYVDATYEASALQFGWLIPTEASWNEIDDRTVTCILYDMNLEKLTGSMQGSGV
jgi:Septum formation